jgi:hypothetical protein
MTDDNDLNGIVGNVPLDIDAMRKGVSTFTSEKLCSIIVCDRYFGCYHDVAIMCMTELALRRANGDNFPFEKVIDEEYAKLPQLNFNSFDIRDVIKQAAGNKK